ncbi:MAG: hypothetical protein ACREUG_06255, partial [Steroidobacteraceae bacterium]
MGAGLFFQKYLNPIGGGPLGQIAGGKLNPLIGPAAWAGKNSFLAKESAYDPVAKFLNPGAQAAGQAWLQRQAPPPGYQPGGYYNGMAPTLATAQDSYQTPSGAPIGTAPSSPSGAPTPRPGGAPIAPRVTGMAPPQTGALAGTSGASPYTDPLGAGFSRAVAASRAQA